jgi:phage baseplate assembly protein W
MVGFGGFPIGSTPFGAGTPVDAIAPPENKPERARFLNPITGDYEVDDDGEYKRMPIVRQRVLLRLGTLRGSSTVLPNFGLRLPERIDARYKQGAEEAIRVALADMITNREIKIVRIDTTIGNPTGRVEHTVVYTDLTTGNSDTVTI